MNNVLDDLTHVLAETKTLDVRALYTQTMTNFISTTVPEWSWVCMCTLWLLNMQAKASFICVFKQDNNGTAHDYDTGTIPYISA